MLEVVQRYHEIEWLRCDCSAQPCMEWLLFVLCRVHRHKVVAVEKGQVVEVSARREAVAHDATAF
jgi:hypothetical protein